ncbi:MAG: S9 family peptidase [Pseudomonadota bacterium]
MVRSIGFISLLLFSVCFSVSHAKKLPIKDFFKSSDFGVSKISPDAKHLAVIIEEDGRRNLAILRTKDLKPLSKFEVGKKRNIIDFDWVNNERIIFMTSLKIGSLAAPVYTGEVYAGNVDGSKKRMLLGDEGSVARYRVNVLSFLREDKKHILVALPGERFTKVVKLDVYSGRQKQLAYPPIKNPSLLVDSKDEVRFAVAANDDREMEYYFRADKKSEWELLEKRKEEGTTINPVRFVENDTKVLVFQSSREKNKNGFFIYDPQQKSFKLKHLVSPGIDIRSRVYDSEEYSNLIGYVIEPDYPDMIFFDEQHPHAQLYRSLQASFPGHEVSIRNTTHDGNFALVSVSSDKLPGTTYLFDLKNSKVQFLYSNRPWIKPAEMAEMQAFHFKARDGKTIPGYYTLPKGKSKNLPMVLYVHGGPYGVRDSWGYDTVVQFLANRGYAVFQINYRGSGGYGIAYQYDAYRQMGAEMQDDLTDATHWAIKQGIADKDRICIFGASYGGYASLMGAVKEPDLYQCAIPYVGLFDIDLFQRVGDIQERKAGRAFQKAAWGDNEAFFKERSPIHHLDKLKIPLFIVHGKQDVRTHFSQYQLLTKKLDEMDYPYESLVKSNEGHGFTSPENNIELYGKLEKFLKKHIGQ